MHLRTYLATTRRILTQLRADRRTVGLIAIVPAALLELPDKNAVIKAQVPTGILLLLVNVFLMYFLMFL